ncbi:hypothetical protein [[Eubacterium] cellulosolvens]
MARTLAIRLFVGAIMVLVVLIKIVVLGCPLGIYDLHVNLACLFDL